MVYHILLRFSACDLRQSSLCLDTSESSDLQSYHRYGRQPLNQPSRHHHQLQPSSQPAAKHRVKFARGLMEGMEAHPCSGCQVEEHRVREERYTLFCVSNTLVSWWPVAERLSHFLLNVVKFMAKLGPRLSTPPISRVLL